MKIELAIGTRFRYNGKLCEVVEPEYERCRECVICYSDCKTMACEAKLRRDDTKVCFKLVEE